ncbi:MAG TPA: metallopeptidase TldD-related protein [Acidimicrobiia bacterium]|nr:metallopeptidase TldD-related protein [Acidimicrobiia bacterium]
MSSIDIARKVVEMVGDRGEAEAVATSGRLALTRFANSFIHQNVSEDSVQVFLRVAADGRVAALNGNRADDASLQRLADSALEAAALQPPDDDWPGVAPKAEIPEVTHVDPDTRDVAPEVRASLVADFISAGDGYLAAGYCDSQYSEVAFVNSAGQEATGEDTRATIDGIHQTGESAGSAHQTAMAIGDIDGAAAGALAAERARMGLDAFDLKPGEYEVVLSPECVATIAIFLDVYGFSGKNFNEGQSFVELGEKQFDERLTIYDDPLSSGALGIPFDTEGTPKERLEMVTGGVTKNVAHDRRSARKAGARSTGHAFPQSASFGAVADSVVVAGGDEDVEDLVAAVDRGLYVATFNYCRVLDPKTQVVTGLTRNGTFMIENGRITGAVTNMRFTQSFVAALGDGRILGIGNDQRFADSEFGPGYVRAPSMRLASWNFTGGSEG